MLPALHLPPVLHLQKFFCHSACLFPSLSPYPCDLLRTLDGCLEFDGCFPSFRVVQFTSLLVTLCGCYSNALYCLKIRMSRGQNVTKLMHEISIQHYCNVLDIGWVHSKHFFCWGQYLATHNTKYYPYCSINLPYISCL